jgi:hypothetical protein
MILLKPLNQSSSKVYHSIKPAILCFWSKIRLLRAKLLYIADYIIYQEPFSTAMIDGLTFLRTSRHCLAILAGGAVNYILHYMPKYIRFLPIIPIEVTMFWVNRVIV